MKKVILSFLLLIGVGCAGLLAYAGCVLTVSGPVRGVEKMITDEIGSNAVKNKIRLSFGPFSVWLAKLAARHSGDPHAEEASGYLAYIDHVDVSVQELDHIDSAGSMTWLEGW